MDSSNQAAQVYEAMKELGGPVSRSDLVDFGLAIEPDQISKALHYLRRNGHIKSAGERTVEPKKKGQRPTVPLYRLAESVNGYDHDLDAELAAELAAIERAPETEPEPEAEPELETEPEPEAEPELEAAPAPTAESTLNPPFEPAAGAGAIDPVIAEIAAYHEPRIADGRRLAHHLDAGAALLQERLPLLAESMRRSADALREVAA